MRNAVPDLAGCCTSSSGPLYLSVRSVPPASRTLYLTIRNAVPDDPERCTCRSGTLYLLIPNDVPAHRVHLRHRWPRADDDAAGRDDRRGHDDLHLGAPASTLNFVSFVPFVRAAQYACSQAISSGWRTDYWDHVALVPAVHTKVRLVHRKNSVLWVELAHANQTEVCQIWPAVCVLSGQAP